MSVTAKTLIKRALRKINAYDREVEPTNAELVDSLEELNGMLREWFTNEILIMHTKQENFALSAGTAEYTIGSGATFNTIRPYYVKNAFIRSSGVDYPLEIVSSEIYRNRIETKSDQGLPYLLNYHPEYANGVISLYFTPDSAYQLYFDNVSPLAEITNLNATFTLGPEYENPIVYNLSIRLASEFGRRPEQLTVDLAVDGLRRLKSLNLARTIQEASLDVGLMDNRVNKFYTTS